MSIFCGRKWRRGDSRPRRQPTRSRPLPHFFLHFTSFELRDQSTSGYQSVTLAKSFHSRTNMGFEIRSRKRKKKDKLAMKNGENSWKPKQACGAPRIDLELSWSEDRSRLSEAFRCSCVYFATQYNVHYDNRQAGHLLSALRLEKWPPLFFPTKKWRKITNSVTVHL